MSGSCTRRGLGSRQEVRRDGHTCTGLGAQSVIQPVRVWVMADGDRGLSAKETKLRELREREWLSVFDHVVAVTTEC
jgi:hypothetical protein